MTLFEIAESLRQSARSVEDMNDKDVSDDQLSDLEAAAEEVAMSIAEINGDDDEEEEDEEEDDEAEEEDDEQKAA